MGFRIGIDAGGTFTDIVAYNDETQSITITKVPSTPQNPAIAVEDGLRKITQGLRIRFDSVSQLVHGTTVATNALLERKGAKTALITTEGFRDVFEIGRQRRPDLYNFWVSRPKPPIPRYLIYEVPERILYDGQVLKYLDEDKADQVIQELKKQGIESVAVCFLHSYINPINEMRMKALLLDSMPEAHMSISCEILPEIKEYERVCTTAVNAYLMPKVEIYMRNLEHTKENMGIRPKLNIMQSNGGLMDAEIAALRSVHTILSGPAGGVIATTRLCNAMGEPNVISLDMGGTSSDMALIENHEVKLTSEGEIGGFPIRAPMLEIHTIGAGGGSIAWVARVLPLPMQIFCLEGLTNDIS